MKFCKICYDKGYKNFNDHNVRDQAGNTTCVYLLNTKCTKCGYFGHTSKYCKMPPNNNLNYLKHVEIKITKKPKKIVNQFELLEGFYDNNEEVDKDEENSLPPVNEIIWGKGFKNSKYTLWSDEVC
tara:strand:- start:1886 stop:2263 length:378 start_codon:yes stop_codon:yes gene_type:complete